jgi:hypothetical protein
MMPWLYDMKKAWKRAWKKAMENAARNALAEGLSLELVAKITGLDMETLKIIQAGR